MWCSSGQHDMHLACCACTAAAAGKGPPLSVLCDPPSPWLAHCRIQGVLYLSCIMHSESVPGLPYKRCLLHESQSTEAEGPHALVGQSQLAISVHMTFDAVPLQISLNRQASASYITLHDSLTVSLGGDKPPTRCVTSAGWPGSCFGGAVFPLGSPGSRRGPQSGIWGRQGHRLGHHVEVRGGGPLHTALQHMEATKFLETVAHCCLVLRMPCVLAGEQFRSCACGRVVGAMGLHNRTQLNDANT
eukprot:scaffold139027_cov20-Tisochrysis_lutea.AAC.2